MAITKVSLTKSLTSAVRYLEGKPHNKDITKRNLGTIGINVPSNFHDFTNQAMATLKSNPKVNKNSDECIRTIISFNPKNFQWTSYKNRKLALKISARATKRHYKNCQSLISLEADNTHNILHCHCLTCARTFTDGHSVTHSATFKSSYPYTDEACKHFGLQPSTTPTRSRKITNSAAIHRKQANNYSYLFDLRQRINSALLHSASLNGYCNQLVRHGVYMRLFRRSHGKLHIYKTPGNINIPYKNGFLRLTRHVTYDFKDQYGKTRVIRPTKLGTDTDRGHVMKILNYNATHTKNMGIYIKPIKNRSQSNFGRNKRKITLNQLRPTVKTRHYNFVNTGPQFSKDQKPELKTSKEPLQHPLLSFHPHHANLALARLFRAFRLPEQTKQEKIARNAEITRARAKFSEKAYQAAVSNYHDKQFLFLNRQANRAAAKYNFETKRALWIQAHQSRNIGPTW